MSNPHGAVVLSVIALPLMVFLLGLAFWAGRAFEAARYDDACLDLGGGRNPEGYPICVLSD